MKHLFFSLLLVSWVFNIACAQELNVLIIDGQNNHDMWPKTTAMMKHYLEETGLFRSVDVVRTKYTWKGEEFLEDFGHLIETKTEQVEKPKSDPNFSPFFEDYDVVVSNFGWNAAPWSEKTKKNLEDFVSHGGGLVVVHAANNSFPNWPAYNRMIGLGGWGDRTEKDGPYVYYNEKDELKVDDSPGRGGSHGPQHEFEIEIRDSEHPITKGMPQQWLHTKDELYDRLRGPAENMHVLATAFSSLDKKGTGRHEPMLMTIDYDDGRIFHTPMGHADYSMECVGFITSLQRGVEWAATGQVTQELPQDFPERAATSSRPFSSK